MSKIHVEVYGQGQSLVMIHGWAMHSGVWREFAQQLAHHCQVICLDLPGHGRSEVVEPFDLQQVGAALLEAIPVKQFALLGWSLGATVALDIAERFPERLSKLIVLAGNPRFVREGDWPGVKAEILDNFGALLMDSVPQTLTRFLALQVNGLAHGKPLLHSLKQAMQACEPPTSATLRAGLEVLKNSDLRESLERSRVPVSWILGDRDTLIPVACGDCLRTLNNAIDVTILENAGHAPFLSHPDQLIALIAKEL